MSKRDDIKARIESAPDGSLIIVLPGECNTPIAVDLSRKKNLRVVGMSVEGPQDESA